MTEPTPSTPDLLMAMLSALPSDLLSRARQAAWDREYAEERRREAREIADAELGARLDVMMRQSSEYSARKD